MKSMDENDIIFPNSTEDIRKVEDLENGDSVYEIGSELQERNNDDSFYANIAEDLSESGRNKLSAFLLEAIDQDLESRAKWMESIDKVKSYLGFSIEDPTIELKRVAKTFDTTLTTALIRFYSLVRAELLPPEGPVDYKINGTTTEILEQMGEQLKDYFNNYLTMVDESYYQDFEKLFLCLGLYGSAFKKVFYDPALGRPISRFIQPADFIVDTDCTSILESNRLTHVLMLTRQEILLNIQHGIYLDNDQNLLKQTENESNDGENKLLKNDGIDKSVYTEKSLLPVYEVHTFLNLEEFMDGANPDDLERVVPLPYIVTIDKNSKEILAIVRNWNENDPTQKRKNYFVQYNYLPGFGIYGLGLAQLVGSNAITLTRILRQLVDAGSFKSMAGGLRTTGFKQQQNDLVITPGEFVSVETGGMPLQQAFMPLPFSEPSVVLKELRQEIVQQTRELAASAELGLTETNQNMPVGTTLALLEEANRIKSAVLRSIHCSFTFELHLLYRLFQETMNPQQDAGLEEWPTQIYLVPVVDPAVNSTSQRIMRAEALLRTASSAPDLHNMREVYSRVYQAFGVSDIDEILKPDQQQQQPMPLDPITENTYIITNKPVAAAEWQDHDAHMVVHGVPGVMDNPAGEAHIREHMAWKYKVQIQQLMGVELPPLEQLQDPELQNAIALKAAEATDGLPQDSSGDTQGAVNPDALLMAEIKAQENETAARERIAELQAEVNVFRSQLDFEKEKAKIESNEAIAELKAETELTKQEIRDGQF